MMKKLIFIFIPLLLVSAITEAAIRVRATIDDPNVSLGQDTVITVSVEGTRNAQNVVIPKVQNLTILQTGRVPVIHIINGVESIGTEFYMRVAAQDGGNFTIPPFKVYLRGKEYRSNSLKLTVDAGGAIPQQAQQNFPVQQPTDTSPKYWIETSVSNKNPYYGEQILFHLRLYTRLSIRQAVPVLPGFDDFLSENITPDQKITRDINGVKYLIITKTIALVPLKEGPITIGKTAVDISYEVESRGSQRRNRWDPIFNFSFKFGFKQTKQDRMTARSLEITVKPLPQPMPANFTHLVGEYGVQTSLSDQQVKEGDSVTMEIHLSGIGNIKDATLPDLKFPGFKIYKDKPTVETYRSNKGLSGKKTFKMALVPLEDGDLTIPGFQLSYFDPKSADYVNLLVPSKEIQVLPSKDEQVHSVLTQNQTQNGQKVTYQDIAPVYSDGSHVLEATSFYFNRGFFLTIVWGLPFIFGSLLVGRFARSGPKKPNKKMLKRTAYQDLLNQLSQSTTNGTQILESVRNYLAAVFSVPGIALTAKEMTEVCIKNQVDKKLATRFGQAIEALEAVQYGFDKEAAIGNAVKEVKVVVAEIQKGVK